MSGLQYFTNCALLGLLLGMLMAAVHQSAPSPSLVSTHCPQCVRTVGEAADRLGMPDTIDLATDQFGRSLIIWRYGAVTLGFDDDALVEVFGPRAQLDRLMSTPPPPGVGSEVI